MSARRLVGDPARRQGNQVVGNAGVSSCAMSPGAPGFGIKRLCVVSGIYNSVVRQEAATPQQWNVSE